MVLCNASENLGRFLTFQQRPSKAIQQRISAPQTERLQRKADEDDFEVV